MSKKMRVVQVPRAGGQLELVERDIPEPKRGWVRVKVEACGVCHSDSLVKEGLWPGIQYPRVPGHEVIGVIDVVGEGVKPWKSGERVGMAGTLATAVIAITAGAVNSLRAPRNCSPLAFLSMAATPNTWSRRLRPWPLCRRNSPRSTAHR